MISKICLQGIIQQKLVNIDKLRKFGKYAIPSQILVHEAVKMSDRFILVLVFSVYPSLACADYLEFSCRRGKKVLQILLVKSNLKPCKAVILTV
jgi:hypothetical protein